MEDFADDVPLIRRLTGDGGLGFCYDVDRSLFTADELAHGPLLVGWDANVLIDFQAHGLAAFEGEGIGGLHGDHEADVRALASLIDLWLMRDIRFLILPRGENELLDDVDEACSTRNREGVAALAEALTFQLGDWANDEPRFPGGGQSLDVSGLEAFPAGADRELIAEAVRFGLDVFLTQDRKVLRAGETLDPVNVIRPIELLDELTALGVQPFSGGILDHVGCPYTEIPPAPDMGRWAPVLDAMNRKCDLSLPVGPYPPHHPNFVARSPRRTCSAS